MFAGLSNAKDFLSPIRLRSIRRRGYSSRPLAFRASMFVSMLSIVALLLAVGCRSSSDSQGVRPRQLRDVPARRLAFSFQADVQPPPNLVAEETKTVNPAIQADFDKRHPDYALVRTIASPDNQRALALYNTTDEPSQTFSIDLYSTDGNFLRDVTPPELAVVFQDSVVWSADSGYIAFVGRKSSQAEPSPTPVEQIAPALPQPSVGLPVATPSVAPAFAPLAVFNTEQVYLCNRD